MTMKILLSVYFGRGMLYHHRRFWAPLAALLLAVPLAFTVVAPTQPNVSAGELRALALAPSFPRTLTGVMDLPPQIDAWLRDHFGMRSTLIHAYALLTQFVLRTGNDSVFMGREGWMFYRLEQNPVEDTIRQSAGIIRHDELVTETANVLVAMKDALAVQGARLVVASPPNTATIYRDYLPRWARNNGQLTEQDLLLGALVTRGVKTVDLRPVLHAAGVGGKVYHLHDTHWTARGAVAAFNAIAEAESHADWRFDMASALGSPVVVTGGDLARMVGINAEVIEPDQFLVLPAGRREALGSEVDVSPTYSETLDRPGPTILIIGDSFTHLLVPMLVQHAGRVVWTHNRLCGFDWKWVKELHPDEVWWMPTERYILCRFKPKGFPSEQARAKDGATTAR
jgi:alginate O-acetyltransferase complex protein AlgJ